MTANLIHADCLDAMKDMADDSVDLIMTSPPYGNQRKNTYGGIDPDGYCDWFLPRAEQFHRILKPTGSFVLNIKEHCENGERHGYVMDLVIALRKQGWKFIETYIWDKKSGFPINPKFRLKNQFEYLFHFTRDKTMFKFRPQNVMYPAKVPMMATKINKKTEGGFTATTKRVKKEIKMAYPSNILAINTTNQYNNAKHSAVYPIGLPEFFIKLLTDEGDLVLDPFCGSATTCEAARNLNRNWIGVDNNEHSISVSKRRMEGSLV